MSKTRQDIVGLAHVCYDSYTSIKKSWPNWNLEKAAGHKYEILSRSSSKTFGGGFYALAFKKTAHENEIVIVIRGTVGYSLSDWNENIRVMNGKHNTEQFEQLKTYVAKIQSHYPDHQIIFTGHSKGGALSHLAAAHFNAEAVTFDAPGTKAALEEHYPSYDSSKITDIVVKGSVIGNSTQHIGSVYEIDIPNQPLIDDLEDTKFPAKIFEFFHLPEQPIAPSRTGLNKTANLKRIEENQDKVIDYYFYKKGPASLASHKHSIENIAKQLQENETANVPLREVSSVGGNVYDALADLSSYSEHQDFYDKLGEMVLKHPAFQHHSDPEQAKVSILTKVFVEGGLYSSLESSTQWLQGTKMQLRAMKINGYDPNIANNITAMQEIIAPIAEKIRDNIELSFQEHIIGLDIAKRFSHKLHLHSKDDSSQYNHEFIANIGEVGRFGNVALQKSCQLQGKTEQVCNNSKIVLASQYIQAIAENPIRSFTLDEHDTMRSRAFVDTGLAPESDVRTMLCTLSSGASTACATVNDYVTELKPHIAFEKTNNGFYVAGVKDQAKNTPAILSAIAVFKEVIADFFSVTVATAIPQSSGSSSFLAANKEEISKVFKVQPEQIIRKYAGSMDEAAYSTNNMSNPFNHLFTVNAIINRDASGFSGSFLERNKAVMEDPEFIVKMISAPFRISSGITMQPITQPVLSPQTVVDSSKFKVEIGEGIHKKHEQSTSQELRNMWKDGIAEYGGHYETAMPASVLNGNGDGNVMPSSIVTGGWRPGARELSTFSLQNVVSSFARTASPSVQADSSSSNDGINFMKECAKFNRGRVSAHDTLNIDPLVIDMSGSGLKLTSWEENNVFFDMNGDGYLEETGWVSGDTGILVIDDNGRVESIHQLLSEKFAGSDFLDGFEALFQFDLNRDGVIDASDPIYSKLKVWFDKSSDGVCREGELKSLQELNIAKIVVKDFVEESKQVNGNSLKRTSKIIMTDGRERKITSVDFAANASGHKYEQTESGLKVVTKGHNVKIIEDETFQKIKDEEIERSTSSFFASEHAPEVLEANALGVVNLQASNSGHTLIASQNGGWLVGARNGANKYKGGSGDDVFVVNEYDEEIEGGSGFNTVFIDSGRGRYLNLAQTQVSVLYGSKHGDVLDASTSTTNCFIQAREGSNLLYGGHAPSVIAGGTGDDIIIGGSGGGVLRANMGNNLVLAKSGNNILEGGIGYSYMIGGNGYNVFKCNAKGYTICDGSSGKFNAAVLPGNIYDYKLETNKDGNVIIRNKNYYHEFSVTLINVFHIDFDGMKGYNLSIIMPQKWSLPSEFNNLTNIDIQKLLSYEFCNLQERKGFAKIHETKGCTLVDSQGRELEKIEEKDLFFLDKFNIIFNKEHTGPVFIKYTPRTASSVANYSIQSEENTVNNQAISILLLRGEMLDINQYYQQDLRLQAIQEAGIQDFNINIQVCEKDSDHADGVASIIRNILPKAKIFYTDSFFTNAHDNMSVLNFSISFHSILRINMEYHQAIGLIDLWSNLDHQAKDSLVNGRNGNGLPAIFAAGNEREIGGDVNYDLIKSLPQVITVGGINRDNIVGMGEALVKPFSNPGANIIVSAPANFMPTQTRGKLNDFGTFYQDSYSLSKGTSFASPIVSAVVGAMVQTNKYLNVYDIKKILAYGATHVSANTNWTFNTAANWNGGGLHHSYDLGFGCLDVHNSITLARNWITGKRNILMKEIIFSRGMENTQSRSIHTQKLTLDGEIFSISVNFIIKNIDIFKLSISLIQDQEQYLLLSSKSGDQIKFPTLAHAALKPITYSSLGTKILDQVGCVFENESTTGMEIGNIDIKVFYIKDNNTNYIFTDEFKKFYDHSRATITADNKFNTLNLSPVTYSMKIDLSSEVLTIHDNHYTLIGNFQNVITGNSDAVVVGNLDNNMIILNSNHADVDLICGHNMLSTSDKRDSVTKVKSGSSADMFIIKKAPGATTTIENFKSNKFDQSPNGQTYSDIINLAAFSDIKATKDIRIEKTETDRIIILPNNQQIIIKNNLSLFGNNFVFQKNINFINLFGEDSILNDTIVNTLYGTVLEENSGQDILIENLDFLGNTTGFFDSFATL